MPQRRNPAHIADNLCPEAIKPFPISESDRRAARLTTARLLVRNDHRASRESLRELLDMLDLLPAPDERPCR